MLFHGSDDRNPGKFAIFGEYELIIAKIEMNRPMMGISKLREGEPNSARKKGENQYLLTIGLFCGRITNG